MEDTLGEDRTPADEVPRDFADEPEQPNGTAVAAVAVVFEGLLGLAALGLGWLFNVPIWSQMRLDAEAIAWGLGGTIPPVVALLLLDLYPVGPFRELKGFVNDHVVPLFQECRFWQFLLIAAAAGLKTLEILRRELEVVTNWR